MKKTTYWCLLLLLLGMFLFFAWKTVSTLATYRESSQSYDALEQYVSYAPPTEQTTVPTQATQETEEPQPTQQTEQTQPADDIVWPQVDFEALREINPDIVGWLFIENTIINYPVVQGKDNDYYLNHLFDGKYNKSGCIFLDANCASDFSDQHSIIYGHNMRDGAMFAELLEYANQDYYDAHPRALLVTPDDRFEIKLFSGYVTGLTKRSLLRDFSEEDVTDWTAELAEKSLFAPVEVPTNQERVITFFTCSYEYREARFILHGYIPE